MDAIYEDNPPSQNANINNIFPVRLTDVLPRDACYSLFEGAKTFQEVAPFRIIDNTFPLRVSVRVSDRDDDWSPDASPSLPRRRNGQIVIEHSDDERYIDSMGADPARFIEVPEQVAKKSMTKYVTILGNTDYDGRGMMAFSSHQRLVEFSEGKLVPDLLYMQLFAANCIANEQKKKIKEWKLPVSYNKKRKEHSVAIINYGPFSGGSDIMEFFKYLPDAANLRWTDAAIRAISRYSSACLSREMAGEISHGRGDSEYRIPSWQLPSSEKQGEGKACYAYVRVAIRKSMHLHQINCQYNKNLNLQAPTTFTSEQSYPPPVRYFPGGKMCYFCGSPKYVTEDNPNGNLLCCSKCVSVKYCSRTCQKNDWKRHKPECKKA